MIDRYDHRASRVFRGGVFHASRGLVPGFAASVLRFDILTPNSLFLLIS